MGRTVTYCSIDRTTTEAVPLARFGLDDKGKVTVEALDENYHIDDGVNPEGILSVRLRRKVTPDEGNTFLDVLLDRNYNRSYFVYIEEVT